MIWPKANVKIDEHGQAQIQMNGDFSLRKASFHIETDVLSKSFGRPLAPELADLVDVAMAVYMTDRLIRRRPRNLDPYELGWQRHITIEIPVRLLDRWNQKIVYDAFIRTLEFFTEDSWNFTFKNWKGQLRSNERQHFLFSPESRSHIHVGLFSGGLDSLAGLAQSLNSRDEEDLISVSGASNPRLQSLQKIMALDARALTGRNLHPLILPLGIHQEKREDKLCEKSQRSRGFLYGTLGAVAAHMAGIFEVNFYENGIGAINLPYNDAQIGTHSTRSTNPVALDYLAKFLQSFLEHPVNLRLTNIFSTKSELCSRLASGPLRDLIPESVSCDSFPLRQALAPQCGICTSCLLRRQSLWAAGMAKEDPGHLYYYDVVERANEVEDQKWDALRVMLWQVETFQRLIASQQPWNALTDQFPMLREVAWTLEDRKECSNPKKCLINLIDRYCCEWDRFPAKPPNWQSRAIDETENRRLRHAC